MRFSKVFSVGGVAAGVLALATGAALADHGKAGLWSITMTMSGDIPGMPDMSKLPPEAQAHMKAMGMSMNGRGMTVEHCMTPKEVTEDTPHMSAHQECRATNVKISGHNMSADMVCDSPDMKGTGHAAFNYDTETHYTGEVTMNGVAHGHQIDQHEKFEGHWVSASCGSVTH